MSNSKGKKTGKKDNPLASFVSSSARAQGLPAVEVPKTAAPPLEGIEVTVPRADDFTEDDLAERFHELAREQGEWRERAVGEPVALGDEVCLDILGYAQGRLIPFSVRSQLWTEVLPAPILPGFFEALVGAKVGEGRKVEVILPPHYPAEALRGASATFLVDVLAAQEVKVLDLESPALLKALGRGPTLEAVMKNLTEELEAELADQLWVEAQDLVLDELVKRAQVEVPEALVDEELRRRWSASESKILSEKGFDGDELKEALGNWQADPLTRADAVRRLAISMVLRAIAEKEQLQLTPEVLQRLITTATKPFGFEPGNLTTALKNQPALAEQLTSLGFHLMTVAHVMARAKVHFEGAPG